MIPKTHPHNNQAKDRERNFKIVEGEQKTEKNSQGNGWERGETQRWWANGYQGLGRAMSQDLLSGTWLDRLLQGSCEMEEQLTC